MLSQIEDFVNWVRRRNPQARTWRDYSYDLAQFAAVVGDRSPGEITHRDIDHFVNVQVSRGFKPATVNRQAAFSLQMIGITAAPEMAANLKAFTAQVKQALASALTGGVYPNFLEGEEAVQRVRDGYSAEAFQRLRELKAKYDPENLLRYSYQIPPANRKS